MSKLFEVKLIYTPPIGGVHKVFVAGSFNNWKKQPMNFESGNYIANLKLTAGKYSYKFLVDQKWFVDESADYFEDDHMGGRNSVLVVEADNEALFIVPLTLTKQDVSAYLVTVAGSFNDWNPDEFFLENDENGNFKLNLLLPAGGYQYKFILDTVDWITDPNNPDTVSDDHGSYNSILEVNEKLPELCSESPDIYTFKLIDEHYPKAETIGNGLIRFACRTYRDNVDSVTIDFQTQKVELKKFYSDKKFDYFSVIIPEKKGDKYRIELHKGTKTHELKSLKGFNVKRNHDTLAAFQKAIIYQIFCDRFCNGDKTLNPDFSEWYYDPQQNPLSQAVRHEMFHFEPDWYNYEILKNHPQRHFTFYGGDLPGVLQNIPYLKELGITCIYFNPLVTGASNHKYDTFDYLQIDPHFGGNEYFNKFVRECHENGISIILDFAFNHVGTGFFAFQDCLKNGNKSKYWNWFDWHNWPLPNKITDDFKAADFYQCWWGHATLPDLNFDLDRLHPDENYIHDINDANVNKGLIEYLMEVVEFWLREMNIDGFRLDVPNEVPFWFWELFRNKVKKIKPNAYIIGEIWQNAEEWIGKYFDSVMNYSYFREPVLQYFALRNWSSDQFLQKVMEGLHNYGFYNLSLMMNLLDSHDTYRFLEACNGNLSQLKLALMFQISWPGIPHLYYGDEVGMMGGSDPDNRRPMNWNFPENKDLSELRIFVQKLISIRKTNNCLIYGDLRICHDDDLIVIERQLENENIVIVLNNSDQEKSLKLEAPYQNLVTKEFINSISLPAYSGIIIRKQ